MQDNPDPGRAYPCRIEYDIVKEQAWRKAWCEDLEEQVNDGSIVSAAEAANVKLPPRYIIFKRRSKGVCLLASFLFPPPPRLLPSVCRTKLGQNELFAIAIPFLPVFDKNKIRPRKNETRKLTVNDRAAEPESFTMLQYI